MLIRSQFTTQKILKTQQHIDDNKMRHNQKTEHRKKEKITNKNLTYNNGIRRDWFDG